MQRPSDGPSPFWPPVIHHGKKLLRIIAGSILLVGGLILSLPGVPGPGVAVMILGLSILSVDFEFARRWMAKLKALGHQAAARLRKKDHAL